MYAIYAPLVVWVSRRAFKFGNPGAPSIISTQAKSSCVVARMGHSGQSGTESARPVS
jgi:hypothetical protein